MSEVPLEYKVAKKKFSKSLQKALGDDLSAIIVYGGAASERVFSGVSDIDFFIVLKDPQDAERSFSENYSILGSEILSFLDNPLFASLLDYEIYTESQLPTKENHKGFSAIRGLALSQGETLVGENPFEELEYSEDDLRNSARVMIQEYLDKLTSLLFIPQFESILEDDEESELPPQQEEAMEAEKEFLAIDAILSSAQAYQMITRQEYVCMPDVVLYSETEPIEGVDNELISSAGLLKQGVETGLDDLFDRAIDFVGTILSKL